jgi:tryptophan-rich sensory protein
MLALCFAVLGMLWTFWGLDGLAFVLILPYAAWLCLAAPLNWRVWRDNPAGGAGV